MRTINTDEIIQTVKEMCIEANLKLSEDMEQAVRNAAEEEDRFFRSYVKIWI